MQQNESSPPVVIEKRDFSIPNQVLDDGGEVIFYFHFTIRNETPRPKVSFTIELNSTLQDSGSQASSPPQPMEYQFLKNQCDFVHITPEGYYTKGTINIIYFSSPIGQFYNDRCNFKFDIDAGKDSLPMANLEGLFSLSDPDNPPN